MLGGFGFGVVLVDCLHRRHFEELFAGRSNFCKVCFNVNCLVVLLTGYAVNVILLSMCEF